MENISIHALLAESDHRRARCVVQKRRFLSTLSLRRATAALLAVHHVSDNFYPRSPCGERPAAPLARRGHWPFLSTLSLRRATGALRRKHRARLFLSTLSLRRATPRPSPSCHPVWDFYPRSPCGERRPLRLLDVVAAGISIHALLAESDLDASAAAADAPVFLSTLSLRRATRMQPPPALRRQISIHALLAESDQSDLQNLLLAP